MTEREKNRDNDSINKPIKRRECELFTEGKTREVKGISSSDTFISRSTRMGFWKISRMIYKKEKHKK